MNNVAACLQTLGDSSAALPLFRRALEGRERVLGAEHPDTFNSLNNLAGCLAMMGDASAALPFFRRATEGFEHVLGADHPDTKRAKANYEWATKAAGKTRSRFRRIFEVLTSPRS
jgi:tetratricopeptide (TPR) repeat protein